MCWLLQGQHNLVNVKCNRLCEIQTYTQTEKASICSAPSLTPSPKELRKGYAAGLKRNFSTASVSSRHHNLLFFHRLTAKKTSSSQRPRPVIFLTGATPPFQSGRSEASLCLSAGVASCTTGSRTY